ncbi:MAG: hypothetical protein ACRDHL_10320 [Candidatus Promineifilaceae bacterium]
MAPTPAELAASLTPAGAGLPTRALLRTPTSGIQISASPRPLGTASAATPTASRGPLPTRTPIPSPTPSPAPPTATPTPTLEISTTNLLPNSSFEDGWYHIADIPELQIPQGWRLEWEEGVNPLDPDPWNAFVRPESRVLTADFLPPGEAELFIWDGAHTLKIFKGRGALSFRLLTDVSLEPGTYLFEINFFPDMVDGYQPDGTKIWAPDPLSGEVQFYVDRPRGGWTFPTFGERNQLSYAFSQGGAGMVELGVAFRGRWAILNNGWFMDDWSLTRIGEP